MSKTRQGVYEDGRNDYDLGKDGAVEKGVTKFSLLLFVQCFFVCRISKKNTHFCLSAL